MGSILMPTSGIHPTAIIDPSAKLGKDVSVGPYAVIDADTVIGDGCIIGAHATIHQYTTVGKNCKFHPGCAIGGVPQDLKFKGEVTHTIIGDNCTFRECCTVNRGCGEGENTIIGNNMLMMAYTHVAHNCVVGDDVIMSNVATLAGHVIVEDRAIIGGLTAVHQFTKIGRNAMVGGMARIAQDVPPYTLVSGDPSFVAGLNVVGMARAGLSAEVKSNLKKAFRILYRMDLSLPEAIAEMEKSLEHSEPVDHMISFLKGVERGIIRPRKKGSDQESAPIV